MHTLAWRGVKYERVLLLEPEYVFGDINITRGSVVVDSWDLIETYVTDCVISKLCFYH